MYQLPSGSWRAQISVDGRRHSATRGSRVEAREWLRQMKERAGLGLVYEAAQLSLADLLSRWLETKRGHLRPKTIDGYERSVRLHINPYIGTQKIDSINRALVQAWIGELIKRKTGTRSIQLAHLVLQGCLEHALQIGMLVHNPARLVMIPKDKKTEMKVWTESQVSQFLVAARGDALEMLYNLALATGMRRGELLGLQWRDIDWSGRIQVVRQAGQMKGGGYEFGEPKTARGRRMIEVGGGIVDKLRAQEKKVHELHRVFVRSWQENDLVFPSERGTPISGSGLDVRFHRLARRAGVPVIRFHDLRHTAATLMLSHGIPPVIVSGMLGHSPSVLMAKYAHYIPSMQGEAARLMDELTRLDDMQGAFSITHELPTR